ncbi:MAG: bifunctional 5,10-methylenetetrahydrofolate dehydrogenase/5,10-methenyltetrahydrofolate cyclohydrolase [Coriobacteriaceae bacterium]|nr:bifunctional 5,10-methylenetetrahydrofolate dehydrogenase/5,10-methenyltetrahydrofolate cyclohydrolase [Coriobacteriaceae bacterium]
MSQSDLSRRIKLATLLKGAAVVEALNQESAEMVKHLEQLGVSPTLAIVRVGEREDDIAYERGATKRCEKVGVAVKQVTLSGDCSEAELIETLEGLNADDQVHGILLFRPLPKYMDEDRVRNIVAPNKDIDGITDLSLAGVFTGVETGFAPCTAQACMEILDFYGIETKGKRAVVIGRSLVVGKPAALMLISKNATVTVCHTRTIDMPAVCRQGEIVIVSAGRPGIVDASYLSEGQVVIDVGINVTEDGNLVGDVDFEAAEPLVGAITPVPGGVGTVTTSVLVKHVVQAAQRTLE